jgi:serine/threonine protein kinase
MVKFDKKVPIIGFLIKLSDFGFSKVMEENELTGTQLGTPATGAPEIMIGDDYNAKVDLWSVGVIMFQLLYNRLPFPAKSKKELIKNILNSNGVKLPENNQNPITEICFDLINKLLKKKPDDRIEFEDYFKHKFFSESHLKELMEKSKIKEDHIKSINNINSEKNDSKEEKPKNKEIDIKIFEIIDFDKRFEKLIKIKEFNGYKLYKAKDKKSDKNVFIKEIILDNKDKNKDNNLKIVNKEIELLASLKGNNFPEFIGYSKKDSIYNIVIEYFSGHTLEDFINRTHKKLSQKILDSIYTQLKPSFLELKEKNIEFDSLSSNNFAFSFYQSENNFEVKFFDYGINTIFFEEKCQMFKMEDFLNFDVKKIKVITTY